MTQLYVENETDVVLRAILDRAVGASVMDPVHAAQELQPKSKRMVKSTCQGYGCGSLVLALWVGPGAEPKWTGEAGRLAEPQWKGYVPIGESPITVRTKDGALHVTCDGVLVPNVVSQPLTAPSHEAFEKTSSGCPLSGWSATDILFWVVLIMTIATLGVLLWLSFVMA